MGEKLSVDEFIQARVLPQFHPVVEMIRQMMRENAPLATETIAYGIPVFKMHKIFAVISPTRQDITLSFTHGSEFDDPYHLLRGVGKVSKHIKLKTVAAANQEAMRYYIKQALEIDAK